MRKPRVQELIRSLIARDGRVTAGGLAHALGVSRQAAHRHLARPTPKSGSYL